MSFSMSTFPLRFGSRGAGQAAEPVPTWYVDNAATGANNGTSWPDAWESFGDIAWGSISPGDRIEISGGTTTKRYTESLLPGASGTSDAPIVITRGSAAGHNGEPIIDRENGAAAWYGVDNGWAGTARNYITIKNIAAENAASAGIHSRNSTGFRVEDCRVLCGSVTTDQPRGIDLRSTTDAVVTGNTVRTPASTTGQTDGIYTQGSDNLTIASNDVQVDNTDDTGHSDAWQSVSDGDVLVERNLFVSPTSGDENHVVIISDILNGAAITFRNNVCWSRGGQYNVTYFRAGAESTDGTFLAYNNTIHGGDRAVNFERTDKVELKNNIIVPDDAGTGVYVALTDLVPGNVTNNLVHAPSAAVARTVADGNRTWAQWLADGYNANGENGDPLLTDPANGDFTLQALSPAIDEGVTLASVTVDYAGTARPQGSAYDIGAYEGTA